MLTKGGTTPQGDPTKYFKTQEVTTQDVTTQGITNRLPQHRGLQKNVTTSGATRCGVTTQRNFRG